MNVRQKKQRSRDKITHIMHPNLKKKEKPKQSRQFCYSEKFLWFGVDHNRKNEARNQSTYNLLNK